MKVLASAVAISILGGVGAAQALTATFDFTGFGTTDNNVSLLASDVDGVFAWVSGYNYTNSGGSFVAGDAIDVDTNFFGLLSGNGDGDFETLDSWGVDEALVFSFSTAFTLTDVTLGWYEGGGWFDVFADGAYQGNTGDATVLPTSGASTLAIGAGTTSFYGDCVAWDGTPYICNETALKIASITLEIDPAVVPLPAAGGLLLTGLLGLGLARRRQTRS